jgi:hypothetical protein
MTEKELIERWQRECDDWRAIRDELAAGGVATTAFEVSEEQRKRAAARGEPLLTHEEIAAAVT